MSTWTPLTVELRENGVLVQKTIQRTEHGPIEIIYPPQHQTSEDIQIDEWNGLTDKLKVELVRAAPKLTVLELIELVEEELRIKNK